MDRKLIIATGTSRNSKQWKNTVITWDNLKERLKITTRTSETVGEYNNMTKKERDERKDVGGFVGGKVNDGRRKADGIAERHIITLDADYASMDFCDSLEMLFGSAWCVYSTHTHTPEKPRYRLLIPLSRAVTADEYEAIARKVAQEIGIDLFDTTYQAHRLMYWPSTCQDGEYIFKNADCAFLNPEQYLNKYSDWKDVTQWPTSSRTVKTREKLAKKQQDPTEKNGIVGAFCRTYDIPSVIEKFIPDVYTPCGEERYTYTAGSTAAGAILYDGAKFLYSNHATDPTGSVLCNAFDLVRIHKFGALDEDTEPTVPMNKRPSYVAMQNFADNDAEVKKMVLSEAIEDFVQTEDASIKNGKVEPTIRNFRLLINGNPELRGKFAFNDFTKRLRVFGSLPWNSEKEERDWADADDAGLRDYIEHKHGVKNKSALDDAFILVAQQNKYHPIRDYLNSLAWDAVPRLERLFIEYLGADDNQYVRAVTKMAFTAAVARIFVPGIKYDTMVVLVGPQGCGKSHILKLVGIDWFSDTVTTVQGKDAYEQIQGFWIIEIPELAAMKKTEVETTKHFVAKSEDAYRPAYGRRVENYKRQCVFFGTTNKYDFLKDPTGNRRFWPIDVNPEKRTKDMWKELNRKEINQLWAEAVQEYKKGGQIFIGDKELEKLALDAQESHLEIDPREGLILDYVTRLYPNNWDKMDLSARRLFLDQDGLFSDITGTEIKEKLCAAEIWCEVLGGNLQDLTRSKSAEINAILERLPQCERMGKTAKFGRIYGVQRGFAIRMLP